MGLGDRIKRIFKSEANAAVDKLEDPTKISEQILRELNENLAKAIDSEAQVKAIALKNKADLQKNQEAVADWEHKLNGILDKIEKGTTPDLENLSKIAAQHYNDAVANAGKSEQLVKISDAQVAKMEGNIKTLQSRITEAKDKTKNIQARQEVAKASEVINKSLSSSNTDGLMSTLDRMEESVSKTEFTAEAYAESASNTSDEAKINEVLGSTSADDTLAAFMAKRKK